MMRTPTLIPFSRAVASSFIVIWNEPSPARSITKRSGAATFAPIAAGNPNPIVPSPPDVMKVRFLRTSKKCSAHIWCLPTSVARIASSGRSRFSSQTIRWGRRGCPE